VFQHKAANKYLAIEVKSAHHELVTDKFHAPAEFLSGREPRSTYRIDIWLIPQTREKNSSHVKGMGIYQNPPT
jgi:hypothetical protein